MSYVNHKISRAGLIATGIMALITAAAYWIALGGAADGRLFDFEWLRLTDTLAINIGFEIDSLSRMMLVVVTTISLLVHVYSLSYMRGERGEGRYYFFLQLFTFSMLGLVVATNLFQMYLFWELVGASSYLLIGFYYEKPKAVQAAKKAFIVTRFADLGFLIGILLVSVSAGSFDFAIVNKGIAMGALATWAGLLFFVGAAGKSAMMPLHIWLPTAMEGPTPVSALIHAATMVVAGIYLIARLLPFYIISAPAILTVIQWVGGFTALTAAVIATKQTDIKRVLAFSTISQIAYMFCALGVLCEVGAAFHLFTHAFFKALLFLGAGSVIHAVHSNEMSAMGGLARRMPITHITFLIACLAIAGIPPFSGFFSKDMILAATYSSSPALFWTLWLTAGLTAFYMFRLYFRIFWGNSKSTIDNLQSTINGGEQDNCRLSIVNCKLKEEPLMYIPLIILAVATLGAGFVVGEDIDWGIAALSITVAVIGIAVAWWRYASGKRAEREIKIVKEGFGFDKAWFWIARSVIFAFISRPIAWFDRRAVDGAMNGLGWTAEKSAEDIAPIQSGRIQSYAMLFLGGALVIIIIILT